MGKVSDKFLDCLFIFSPGNGYAGNNFNYNLGSGYLISYLRHSGFYVKQFIYKDRINIESCTREILKQNARIVGFTVFNSNFLTSVLIAEKIRISSPDTIIVFGGATSTTCSEFILQKYPFIDLCFKNESEENFLEFISILAGSDFNLNKIDLSGIKGITFRCGNDIQINALNIDHRKNIDAHDYLDKYPSPYLTGVIPGIDAIDSGIITARGCNQNCIYCNCASLSGRRFLTHSVERVISELDYLARYTSESKVLNFYDDAFTLIPQRAKQICREIITNKIRLFLSCVTRSDCVDEELLDLMKGAGFVSVGFSLESANPKTLRMIGKVHKPEDEPTSDLSTESLFVKKLEKNAAYAKRIGIKKIFSSIMVGLPGETADEADKTIDTIDNIKEIDFYSHNILSIYKGTPLFEKYSKYGYRINLYDNNPIFADTIFPDDSVKKVKVSSKSDYSKIQKLNNTDSLKILSLSPDRKCNHKWFKNIILNSDSFNGRFVSWLKDILAINGIILQIYSDKNALIRYTKENIETLIKYGSPSLNIRSYYPERENGLEILCNNSVLQRSDEDRKSVEICDFTYFNNRLNQPGKSFMNTMCRESDTKNSELAYNYFCSLNNDKNLFTSIINSKPLPFFVNMCKWTKDQASCKSLETLFVNDKEEVRLCWYGPVVGKVGQDYNRFERNLKSLKRKISCERGCRSCKAGDYCIKCLDPFPVSKEKYCMNQRSADITRVGELLYSMDIIKQYV